MSELQLIRPRAEDISVLGKPLDVEVEWWG